MLNNSTDLPEAGWYVDPANASFERWWGGLEWTDTTRPLRAKAAPKPHPAQPVFTGNFPPPSSPATSSGGFPPAAPAAPAAGFAPVAPAASTGPFPLGGPAAPGNQLAIAGPAAPSAQLAIGAPAASTGGFSLATPSQGLALAEPQEVGLAGWVPAPPVPGVSELSLAAGYGSVGTAPNDSTVSPSWYASDHKFLGPTPTNGVATAGLIFSIVGLWLVGFILSIAGLVKAGRINKDGFAPIGRARAAWGLTISIVAAVVVSVGGSLLLPVYLQAREIELEQQAAASLPTDELTVGAVPAPSGAYDRATFEQNLAVSFTQPEGAAPESVVCPDSAGLTAGNSITCEIMLLEKPHTVTMTFIDDIGTHTLTVDGVVQEQAAGPVQ